MLHTFQSEPGIKINGSEFKIRSSEWVDESGEHHYTKTAWGRDQNSCGWFFVPPAEKARLESIGVEFVRESVDDGSV